MMNMMNYLRSIMFHIFDHMYKWAAQNSQVLGSIRTIRIISTGPTRKLIHVTWLFTRSCGLSKMNGSLKIGRSQTSNSRKKRRGSKMIHHNFILQFSKNTDISVVIIQKISVVSNSQKRHWWTIHHLTSPTTCHGTATAWSAKPNKWVASIVQPPGTLQCVHKRGPYKG